MFLQDHDVVEEANDSTSLLSTLADVDQMKTRVVAGQLEQLGFRTRLVERRFDLHTKPAMDEPRWAIAGFDKITPRRALGGKFDKVVDGGLGAGPTEYLDITVHTFPSSITPEGAWPDIDSTPTEFAVLPPAYEAAAAEANERDAAEIRCGLVQLAGISVGAAFVGTATAALVLSEIVRELSGGESFEVLSLRLSSPTTLTAAVNRARGELTPPGAVGIDLDDADG